MGIMHGMLSAHRLTPLRVIFLDCCLYSSSLGLLLGTKAPVMTPDGVDFSFLSAQFLQQHA